MGERSDEPPAGARISRARRARNSSDVIFHDVIFHDVIFHESIYPDIIFHTSY